jgi:dolichol-phosphate mannosyltransferase
VAKRVLVSGAASFIGANLARRLVRDGHDVVLLARPGSLLWRLDDLDAPVEAVDLSDQAAVRAIVRQSAPEWIFHLAAHGSFSTQRDAELMVRTNVLGTMILANCAAEAGCSSFVHAGSSSDYGFKDHAPSETETIEPNSDYAVTKAAATLYCAYAARRSGIRAVTLRLYSVYGPFEEPTRLIPQLLIHAGRKELPPLVDPRIGRDFVYVDDVVDAFLAAAAGGEPGAVYNVGTGRQTNLADVVAVAREHFGIAAEPAWGSMPSRSWDTTVWRSDNTLIRQALGWSPRFDLRSGLEATMQWLRSDEGILARYRAAGAPPRS